MQLFARQKRFLGIVVGESSMLVAEISSDIKAAQPPPPAEFLFPDRLTLEDAQTLGKQFAEFLSASGFAATAVVFGVPARRLVCRPVEVPPTDSRTAAQLLWLQASGNFPEDLGPMVFDFIGQTSTDNSSTINLIGLQQAYLDRLLNFAQAAALEPIAITSTLAQLAGATAPHLDDASCLSVRRDGVELAQYISSGALVLNHVASSAAFPKLLTELRRNVVGAFQPTGNPSPRTIVLWNDAGLDGDAAAAIGTALGMAVVVGKGSWLGGAVHTPGASAPLALLRAVRDGQSYSPDFLNPRVVETKTGMRSRRMAAILSSIAAVLILGLIGYADVFHLQNQIAASRQYLRGLEPQLQTARPFASQMEYVKTFRPSQASYLKCLKDITLSIPQGGKTYLTSFMLQADMKGNCIGHSGSDQDVLDLLDKLNGIGRFSGLNRRLDVRPRGNQADVTFSISFTYLPDK